MQLYIIDNCLAFYYSYILLNQSHLAGILIDFFFCSNIWTMLLDSFDGLKKRKKRSAKDLRKVFNFHSHTDVVHFLELYCNVVLTAVE